MNKKDCRTVTFGVIARNEQIYLPELLEDLLAQTYPKELIEVILVDSSSEDETLTIMKKFQKDYAVTFLDLKILNNSQMNQPSGWNVVLKNATSDVILRIDAHARLPMDFVENNMRCINSGEDVCGGPRENIIDEQTPWKQMLLEAEQSMFGAGIAAYRNGTEKKEYVKSVFHAAYRKEVFDQVGQFNEKLIRTEDNEMHYRIRQAGYRICYDPAINSRYQTRNSLPRMLKQKFQNGFWIGKTLFVCPGCISLFHIVPCVFLLGILLTIMLLLLGIVWPIVLFWCAYGVVNLLMTIMAVITSSNRNVLFCLLPFVFLLLHLSYGVGTFLGSFSKKEVNRFDRL